MAVLLPRRLRRCPPAPLELPGAGTASAGAHSGAPESAPADIRRAVGVRARLLGLALLPAPPPAALLLGRTRSVHTFGMRFALDLAWLGRDGVVVRVDHCVVPRRLRGCRAARDVLELPAGGAEAAGLQPGERLRRAG